MLYLLLVKGNKRKHLLKIKKESIFFLILKWKKNIYVKYLFWGKNRRLGSNMNLTSWFLKSHEGDSHILTIEVGARCRSGFLLDRTPFYFQEHFKELVSRRVTSKSTKSYSISMKEREQRIKKWKSIILMYTLLY